MELSDNEKIYVMQAVYKAMADEMSTGKDNARGEFDERMRKKWRDADTNGNGSYNAMLMGQKVGTVTVKPDEPKPKQVFDVIDLDALEDWIPTCEGQFLQFIAMNMAQFAKWWFDMTGEIPPGCSLETVMPEPKEPRVTLTIKPDKVAEVMGALPGDMRPLLGGE